MLIRRPGGGWESPNVDSYRDERELQALVAGSPELIGDSKPVVVLLELPLRNAGRLDALLVDGDGGLTLIEAKLNRNPEIRRAVVGQLLGYAGGLWGMSYEELDAVVRDQAGAHLVELAQVEVDGEEFDEEDFRARVANNLRDGAFRLVFAVDHITEDLKRAVEYLNAHTADSLEVAVMEFAYSQVDDIEILLPRTFGEESARRKHERRAARPWNETEFFTALAERASAEEVGLARRLYEWAKPRVSSVSGGGAGSRPACNLSFEVPEGTIQPCRPVLTSEGLLLRVNLEFTRKRPRPALEAMLDRLMTLPTIAAMRPEIEEADFRKRPAVPIADCGDDGVTALIDSLEALLRYPAEDVPAAEA